MTVEGLFWQARVSAGRSAGDEASKLASDCFAFYSSMENEFLNAGFGAP